MNLWGSFRMFQLSVVPKMNLYDHPTSNRNNSLLYSSLVLSKSLKWGGLLLYINEINITLFIKSYLFQNVWVKFHHRLLWSIVIKRTLFKMKLLVGKYLRCSLWNGLYIVFYISSDVDIYLVLYHLHEKYITISVSNIVTFYDQNESLSFLSVDTTSVICSENPSKFHCKVFQNETSCWNAGVTIWNPSYFTLPYHSL